MPAVAERLYPVAKSCHLGWGELRTGAVWVRSGCGTEWKPVAPDIPGHGTSHPAPR